MYWSSIKSLEELTLIILSISLIIIVLVRIKYVVRRYEWWSK